MLGVEGRLGPSFGERSVSRSVQRAKRSDQSRRRSRSACLGALAWAVSAISCASVAEYDRNAGGGVQLEYLHAQFEPSEQLVKIPLTIHYATRVGSPVVTQDHVEVSIRRANDAMRTFGIEVYPAKSLVLPEGYTDVLGGDDRLRLAELAKDDGTVHVFFVDRVALFSPRHGDSRVSGMHWRYHGLHHRLRQREYLVVAEDAPATTLVHELGHALGLGHSRVVENLMCSCRRSDAPTFTAKQGVRMREGARRFTDRFEG